MDKHYCKEPHNLVLDSRHWVPFVPECAQAQKTAGADEFHMYNTEQGLRIENCSSEKLSLKYVDPIRLENPEIKNFRITVSGKAEKNAGGCLYVNNDYTLALNGVTLMPVEPPSVLSFSLVLSGDSVLLLENVSLEYSVKEQDLTEECNHSADVLVVSPNYPTPNNMCLCAFAHARNRAYVQAGLNIQVASLSDTWYSSIYTIDNVPVYQGKFADLKALISRKQYKTIIIHFVGEEHYPILDGYITNEKLIFICHGPEVTFPILPDKCRPYFTAPQEPIQTIPSKAAYVRKYAQLDNVEWVFISEYVRRTGEELMGVKFRNANCIYNLVDEEIFPYREKAAEDRKKILILRKFDNIRVHSIDISVRTILALSRRPFFEDLHFDVYGDGDYYDELVEPLRQFSNVSLHRTFVPQVETSRIHAENGIILIPSRHDTQGVAMCEAASSGLVVVGSDVTCTGFFLDNEHNHTMVDPEDPEALADVIERLYNDPEEYLAVSRRMSAHVRSLCGRAQTLKKEIALIRRCLAEADANWNNLPTVEAPAADPVLTVLVAAYNVEPWLDKCLYSLTNHRNADKVEILVVNDGSKDRTSEIAHRYEKATNGAVRVIDKENGGHGSTINVGIAQAKGRYFRIVDGDDWVDSENLAKLVDKLETENADIVLTKGCYEYADQAYLRDIIDYDMLMEGALYHYDDLLYPNYGFKTYGPLLTTGNYRTACLRRADFKLSEKKPYVDMEFNSFSQRYIETLRYYDLDIYRYLIGREGQTVSPGFWKTKYQVHASIIFNILETLDSMEDYPENRKVYLYRHLIAMMVDSQIFMYDQVGKRDEIDIFLQKLEKWPKAKQASMDYIDEINVESKQILENYKLCSADDVEPLIQPDRSLRVVKGGFLTRAKRFFKRAVKACVPYGLLYLWRRRKTSDASEN